jgi:uncharacterized protein (DUF952 family)
LEIDLLFAAIKKSDWIKVSKNDCFNPILDDENEVVLTFEGKSSEKIVNHYFKGEERLLLVVIDPLRLRTPFKRVERKGMNFIEVQGTIPIDAIIDKIKLRSDKKGHFSLNIKHFD